MASLLKANSTDPRQGLWGSKQMLEHQDLQRCKRGKAGVIGQEGRGFMAARRGKLDGIRCSQPMPGAQLRGFLGDRVCD